MVFTVSLKHLSFKQDVHNLDSMLSDQKATYAILRYAKDLPEYFYIEAMDDLCDNFLYIEYDKLKKFLIEYMTYQAIVETS